MPAPTRKKIFDLVGESRQTADGTPRQELLVRVEPGDSVVLKRHPENEFDPNAILALWNGQDIGYLSRDDAKVLCHALDESKEYEAQIHEIKGGIKGYASYGAKVSIAWEGAKLPAIKPLDEMQLRSRRGKLTAMARTRDKSGSFVGKGSTAKPSRNDTSEPEKAGCLGFLVGAAFLGFLGMQLVV